MIAQKWKYMNYKNAVTESLKVICLGMVSGFTWIIHCSKQIGQTSNIWNQYLNDKYIKLISKLDKFLLF